MQEILPRLNRLEIFQHNRSLMPVALSFIYLSQIKKTKKRCVDQTLWSSLRQIIDAASSLRLCNVSSGSVLSQRVAADLQARIRGDFGALHQILRDEEACLLERLKEEEEEQLQEVRRHLEAAELGLRELEDNLRVLERAGAAAEGEIVTEVRASVRTRHI